MTNLNKTLFESEDKRLTIDVYMDGEYDTVWLTQKQVAELFSKDVRTINEHINNIYDELELVRRSTIRNFRIVQKEGQRLIHRDVSHYNLDVIISVGYRVKSKRGTQFRQWATKILKEQFVKQFFDYRSTLKKYDKRLESLEQKMEEVIAFIKATIEEDDILFIKKGHNQL